MSAMAAPGWGSTRLPAIRPGEVDLDPAEQLAVQQALVRYAFALDQNDPEALRAVLTRDATWTFRFADADDVGPVVGREAILDLVRGAADAETSQRRHNLVNVVLRSADAHTALVNAYLLLTSNAGGGSALVGTGFYVFRLEREDGVWRIADLFLGTDNAW